MAGLCIVSKLPQPPLKPTPAFQHCSGPSRNDSSLLTMLAFASLVTLHLPLGVTFLSTSVIVKTASSVKPSVTIPAHLLFPFSYQPAFRHQVLHVI